jgi:branched-chain amino acid transport system permease protein
MLGMYLAVWLSAHVGSGWRYLSRPLSSRRSVFSRNADPAKDLSRSELLQLLATFALLLLAKDASLWIWGPEDQLGPRAPGFAGAVSIAGKAFPAYDLLLILLGPLVLAILHGLLAKTRWGILVRAASEDREMAAALGINQRWLFTGVFALARCSRASAAPCRSRASRPRSTSTCR